MKEKETLLKSMDTVLNKATVKQLASSVSTNKAELRELVDLCFDRRAALAFRASWLLEYIAIHFPDRFLFLVPAFLSSLPAQLNKSCQRQFTKILIYLTNPTLRNPYRVMMAGYKNKEELVEIVFHWYIDPQTPVAVKANCMDILFNLSDEFDWIPEELSMQIESDMRTGSAAIQQRGKKILKKLKHKEGEKLDLW